MTRTEQRLSRRAAGVPRALLEEGDELFGEYLYSRAAPCTADLADPAEHHREAAAAAAVRRMIPE